MGIRKRVLAGSIIAAVLVAAAVAGYFVLTNKQADEKNSSTVETQAQSVCSAELVKNANTSIETNNTVELYKSVEQIRNLSNYNKDPNCLYIIVRYNLAQNFTGDNAQLMSDLKKVYYGLDQKSFTNAWSYAKLQERVNALAEYDKSAHESRKRQTDIMNKTQALSDREHP